MTVDLMLRADKGSALIYDEVDANFVAVRDAITQIRSDLNAAGIFNLVTDFGGVPDGTTDNAFAFEAFRTAARLIDGPVVLCMPAGEYYLTDTVHAEVALYLFNGISDLTVFAYDATIRHDYYFRFTGLAGHAFGNENTTFVDTILEGATTATLKDITHASRFTVGHWYFIGAFELQGRGGYPPNHHYNQYVEVTDITGDVLTFTPAATQDYLDTYPRTRTPDLLEEYEPGGPVAFFKMIGGFSLPNSWDCDLEIRGLTIQNDFGHNGVQLYTPGRNIRFIDVTFVETAPIPTGNKSIYFERCTVEVPLLEAGDVEIDKECELVTFKDCVIQAMTVQSSSVGTLILDGTTVVNYCNGTPRRMIIRGNSDINSLTIGVHGYGVTETLVIEAPAIIRSGLTGADFQQKPASNFDNASGVLTYNQDMDANNPLHFYVPGALVYVGGHAGDNGVFAGPASVITSVVGTPSTPDGLPEAPIITTTLPDPLPTLEVGAPYYYFSDTMLNQHPCADVDVEDGVTGCDEALSLARAPKNIPLYSYAYTQSRSDWTAHPAPVPITMLIRGQLVYIKINVVQPYVGPTVGVADFGLAQNGIPALNISGANISYNPRINAAVAGERIITPGAITGAQTGDTLGAAPGLIVLANSMGPVLNVDYTGVAEEDKAIIEVEILCDQTWS